MGFFTTRDRVEAVRSVEARAQAKVAPDGIRDFAPRRRAAEPDLSGHVGVVMQRVTDSSLHEIDTLIARLRQRREQLLEENDRVQRQIVAFAQMSQTTMQSTKIISESLAHFVKRPGASVVDSLEPRAEPADAELPGRTGDPEPRLDAAEEGDAPAVVPAQPDEEGERPDDGAEPLASGEARPQLA
jgi:hypothetical protein